MRGAKGGQAGVWLVHFLDFVDLRQLVSLFLSADHFADVPLVCKT